MNRILLALIFSAVCIANVSAFRFARTSLDEENLKGNVKSIKTYTFFQLDDYERESLPGDTIENQPIVPDPQLTFPLPEYKCVGIEYKEFNKDGMKVLEEYYRTEDTNASTYREEESLTIADLTQRPVSSTLTDRMMTSYDAEGLPTTNCKITAEGDTTYIDKFHSKTIAGNLILTYEKQRNDEPLISERVESTFSPDGVIKALKACTPYCDVSEIFNDEGQLISRTMKEPGSLHGVPEPYDRQWTYEFVYYPGERVTYIIEDGGPRTLNSRDELDSQGNVTRTINFLDDGTAWAHYKDIYIYDAQGNWTKQVHINEDSSSISLVILREIEYY